MGRALLQGGYHANATVLASGRLRLDARIAGIRLAARTRLLFATGAGHDRAACRERRLGNLAHRALALTQADQLLAAERFEFEQRFSDGDEFVVMLGENPLGIVIARIDETANLRIDLA